MLNYQHLQGWESGIIPTFKQKITHKVVKKKFADGLEFLDAQTAGVALYNKPLVTPQSYSSVFLPLRRL